MNCRCCVIALVALLILITTSKAQFPQDLVFSSKLDGMVWIKPACETAAFRTGMSFTSTEATMNVQVEDDAISFTNIVSKGKHYYSAQFAVNGENKGQRCFYMENRGSSVVSVVLPQATTCPKLDRVECVTYISSFPLVNGQGDLPHNLIFSGASGIMDINLCKCSITTSTTYTSQSGKLDISFSAPPTCPQKRDPHNVSFLGIKSLGDDLYDALMLVNDQPLGKRCFYMANNGKTVTTLVEPNLATGCPDYISPGCPSYTARHSVTEQPPGFGILTYDTAASVKSYNFTRENGERLDLLFNANTPLVINSVYYGNEPPTLKPPYEKLLFAFSFATDTSVARRSISVANIQASVSFTYEPDIDAIADTLIIVTYVGANKWEGLKGYRTIDTANRTFTQGLDYSAFDTYVAVVAGEVVSSSTRVQIPVTLLIVFIIWLVIMFLEYKTPY